MDTQELTLEEKLKALRDTYGAQLPSKLAEVTEFWAHLCEQSWDWTITENLHRSVHTLAGSAPTFGFTDVGQNARKVEHVLKEWIANQTSPTESERHTISALITTLTNVTTIPKRESESETDTATSAWTKCQTDTHLIYLVNKNHKLAIELAAQLSQFDYRVKIFNDSSNIDTAMKVRNRP